MSVTESWKCKQQWCTTDDLLCKHQNANDSYAWYVYICCYCASKNINMEHLHIAFLWIHICICIYVCMSACRHLILTAGIPLTYLGLSFEYHAQALSGRCVLIWVTKLAFSQLQDVQLIYEGCDYLDISVTELYISNWLINHRWRYHSTSRYKIKW